MNTEALKKALLQGIVSGVVTWLIYGLVFQMLIDKEPFKEALFGWDSIVFLVIITIAEVVLYYFRQVKGTKKS